MISSFNDFISFAMMVIIVLVIVVLVNKFKKKMNIIRSGNRWTVLR
jgi:hypothetical protein